MPRTKRRAELLEKFGKETIMSILMVFGAFSRRSRKDDTEDESSSGEDVREVVEEAAPGDDQRQAGLAGRGVAVAVPTEAAHRALAALTRAAAPPEDRCGGGKHRYTTANLRLGERGT